MSRSRSIFAAINLSYDFGRARDYASGLIVDGSEFGLNAAATARLLDWLYIGGEVRYLRAYDGLAFGNLVGRGGDLGLTFYLALGRGASLSRRGTSKPGVRATGLDPGPDLASLSDRCSRSGWRSIFRKLALCDGCCFMSVRSTRRKTTASGVICCKPRTP